MDLIIISLKINLFSPWYRWNIAELTLNNDHSLTVWTSIQASNPKKILLLLAKMYSECIEYTSPERDSNSQL
jgi:hypothetical protein